MYYGEVFVQTKRRKSEVCTKQPKANTLPYRQSKEVNKLVIMWLLVHIFVYFHAVFDFSFSEFVIYVTCHVNHVYIGFISIFCAFT